MSELTIKGKIYKVGDVQTFGSNGFRKREILMQVRAGDYPEFVQIDATKDRADDEFSVGDEVEVEVFLNGSKIWNDPKTGRERAFVSLNLKSHRVLREAVTDPVRATVDESDIPF